ncbi:MAG: RagB/SusD family nutrient uptake outer membrane protein [Bacteroidetes bacterium]|nr:RagB/SusD family nutrient uptake outer membrane protein [Bacteroidota bacterium]
MLKKITIVFLVFGLIITEACTKLDERFQGDTTQSNVASSNGNTGVLLQSLYNSMTSTFTWVLNVFPLQEICTDEAIFPTRGGDWDDNGIWRSLHSHKWAANHDVIKKCFNSLNGINYQATDLLRYNPTVQQQAEARFIRAWVMYLLLDMYDQVPYRDPGESLVGPSRVRKGTEALDYIISELNGIESDLPGGPAYIANKYAVKTLLMKCYLNKMIYKNRADPPAADPADMNIVIGLADDIIKNGPFGFSLNYYDNFAPDNTTKGKENIFTLLNEAGSTPNNSIWITWCLSLHYSQDFGAGFNGCSTLSDFYKKFEPADKRRGIVYSTVGSPPNPANAINAGFLVGQQYDYFSGEPLFDRHGAPLVFIPEVNNIETGINNEVTGIRAIKYFPDWANFSSPDNDFVFFRFTDVLLMKAEAIERGGAATNAGIYGSDAKSILNSIRMDSSRGASALSTVSLDDIYDERGRELWWEGWRRQDMIRFKKFLLPFQEKNYQSDPAYLLFPIPDEQIAVNPNLKQNSGY